MMTQIQTNLSRKSEFDAISKYGAKPDLAPKKPLTLFFFLHPRSFIHLTLIFIQFLFIHALFPDPLSMSIRPPLLLFNVNNRKMSQNIRQFYPILISLLLMAIQSSRAGSYESAELSSSELQSGKRMSPYGSYQPWSYMKRAPTAPIIRFGKRSSEPVEWVKPTPRNIRSTFVDPLIRFGKRVPSGAPLIRFGRQSIDGAPLIRFGKRAGAPLIRFGKRTPIEENWEEMIE